MTRSMYMEALGPQPILATVEVLLGLSLLGFPVERALLPEIMASWAEGSARTRTHKHLKTTTGA